MKYFIFIPLILLISSCTSFDVDKSVKNDSGVGAQNNESLALSISPEMLGIQPVIIEVPVFVPASEAPPARPAAGVSAVENSNRAGIIRPQDYSHSAFIYDYNPDLVYEVYTQPLRVSDISLQPGEVIIDTPFVSDSERWDLGAGVSYDNGVPVQHIYVRPASSGLSASLIINTNTRVYRIILRSYNSVHMPLVRWRYNSGLPNNFISASAPSQTGDIPGIDPRFLSFNYRITYGLFKKPNWLPRLVFDDGSKTYINFPETILQRELPAVFENRRDILNYRTIGNIIVIDKLIENITVRIGKTEIIIRKKRR